MEASINRWVILLVVVVFSASLLAAVGDGGLSDSTVTVVHRLGLSQAGSVGAFSDQAGSVLYSSAFYFDMKVSANGTAYTRGLKRPSDTTFYGMKFLDFADYVGQIVHVLAFRGIAGDTLVMYVEEAIHYDSTLYAPIAGASYGYIRTDTLFGNGIPVATGGGAVRDSFYVHFPIVRFMFRELDGAETDTVHFVIYAHRPNDQYAAPNGYFKPESEPMRLTNPNR